MAARVLARLAICACVFLFRAALRAVNVSAIHALTNAVILYDIIQYYYLKKESHVQFAISLHVVTIARIALESCCAGGAS